ncbi:hypothetical protein A3H26_00850 [candidate division WWE3 bacterium RIFCSPLOWO2_12_FULL_36_10]|uniref:Uncharacterized protein n=1 Tax=candidate division WWE3 bacterium RIFCSPLOWO2_12_FULL_36_10 TaxID=1802630 RepID=A0A1F4VL17_UNCKA|nr:MAG: hypothetical protein A3H26_00850 [candidate division WWE3 bacterium RIFCSPLOWO2_12_FULL_36_10]
MPTPYQIKSLLVSIATLILSYILFYQISIFVKGNSYLGLDIALLVKISALILITLYIYTLTSGSWNSNFKYFSGPLPISLSIFLISFKINVFFAGLFSIFCFLLLLLTTLNSASISETLIKFKPRIVLAPSIKGLFFVLALSAGFFAYLNVNLLGSSFDIKKTISDLVTPQVNKIVESQLSTLQTGELGNMVDKNEIQKTVNTTVKQALDRILATLDLYKSLVPYFMALLAFGYVQFISMLVGVLYSISIDFIFYLFKKIKLLSVTTKQVDKESISF